MKTAYKEAITHPLVLGAAAFVVAIAIGGGLYYAASTKVPNSNVSVTSTSTIPANLTATGTVEPSQNPDLAFQSGGRVVSVNVAVGQMVGSGQVLASLDTAALAAQRAGAEATLASQQAQLAQLEAGARSVDVAAKQTAIDQAQASLQNVYTNAATTIGNSYDKTFSSISATTDSLFNQPNSASPTLVFTTSNNQITVNAVNARTAAEAELAAWNTETASLPSDTPAQLEAELTLSLNHLTVLSNYTNSLLAALASAIPSSSFSSAQVSAAQTSVGALQTSLNTLTTSLQSEQQQITSGKLAITQAQDALNQVTAPATPQDIAAQQAQVAAAQAQIDSFNAQIENNIVVAPFAGTVASVEVKKGDIVAPNTVAISLNPESALQVVAYFNEIDITKIKAGDAAQVTLDAYGNGKVFPATVVSVDTAPSPTSDAPNAPTGYKATFQFLTTNSAITSGMTANITIPLQ